MKSILRRPSPATVIASLALFVAMGGFAIGAIPDKDGVIYGCFKKKKGTLRLVEKRARCKKSERRVSWNQQGLQGKQGTQGAQGAPGANGTALGFARVNSTGNDVFEEDSKNITDANVASAAVGKYCFDNLPFTPHNAQVTARHPANAANSTHLAVFVGDDPLLACPGGPEDASVVAVQTDGTTLINSEFYILFN